MMLRPILDRIVVRPLVEMHSKGGIALVPHEDTGLVKEVVHGEVVAVGPGKHDKKGRLQSMWGLKPGDRIAHSPVGQVKAPDGLVVIRRDAVIGLTSHLEAA
jgi:co-chaperonin GroES (HSP10)